MLDQAGLEEAALRYLDRYDASAARLTAVLMRRGRTALKLAGESESRSEQEAQLVRWVAELVARYRASGILDDRRFASNLLQGLRQRGASRRAVAQKLRARGLDSGVIDAVLAAERVDDEPSHSRELLAAQQLVKRRRLGPYRAPEERAARRAADLAKLGRAGFDRDVALQALAMDDAEEF
jgi:regulatory protein